MEILVNLRGVPLWTAVAMSQGQKPIQVFLPKCVMKISKTFDEIEEEFGDVISTLINVGRKLNLDVEEALRRIAATTACHAAVKANDRLTFEKMTYILQELKRTDYSTVCPHGRPVVLRLTRHEIEKKFERV